MLQKIHQALVQYLETNQRDNQTFPTGWRRRLQDIYLAHYRQQHSSTTGTPSHLWQHHAEKK